MINKKKIMPANNFEKIIKILAIIVVIALCVELGIAFFINSKKQEQAKQKLETQEQLKKEIQNTVQDTSDKNNNTTTKTDPATRTAPPIPTR